MMLTVKLAWTCRLSAAVRDLALPDVAGASIALMPLGIQVNQLPPPEGAV